MTADSHPFVIREAQAADDAALRRLAALDGSRVPAGRILVAEVDGEIVAAVSLAGGPAITDTFRPIPAARMIELRGVAAALRQHLLKSSAPWSGSPSPARGHRRRGFAPTPALA
jgi:hypothetical protein